MTSKRKTAAALVLVLAGSTAATAGWRPQPLPRDEEIAAALEAGPPLVRDAAGVYVLTPEGFELARPSRNGFHCLVQRSQEGAFEPQCFDAVGSATILQQVLLQGRLQMAGDDPDAIERQIAEAWRSGALRPPTGPGINYMLSKRNRVPVGPGRVIPYGPHVMFHVPYRTNADVGGDPQGGSPVFVINEGEPGAYVIVPVAVPAADRAGH